MSRVDKETFNAICEAATSFKIKNLLENQEVIIKSGRITPLELDSIIDKIFDIEFTKQRILLFIKKKGFAIVPELVDETRLTEFEVYKALGELMADNLIVEKKGAEKLSFKPKVIMSEVDGNFFLKLSSIKTHKVPLEPIIPIVENHLCCGCGACYSVCPVKAITMDETPRVDEETCIHCGLCWAHCPRTHLNLNVLKGYMTEKVDFKKDLKAEPIGPNISVVSAQTSNEQIAAVAQDGGVVTSLLTYLFDKNLIDGAIGVVQKEGEPWNTQPILMTSKDDVLKAAGTIYSIACNLAAFEKIKGTGLKKIAFVGTPCQVQAMRKYQVTSDILNELWGKVNYIIGIFCMESFPYQDLIKIVEEHCKTPLAQARKMNIDKGKFFVHRDDGGPAEVEIKEVTKYARHACHFCVDLTNELCDVSSGSIGSPGGWNTVITRTKIGEELFQNALKEGYIRTKEIEKEKPFGIKLTRKLSNIKRKKGLKYLEKEVLEKKLEADVNYYLALKDFVPPKEEEKELKAEKPKT